MEGLWGFLGIVIGSLLTYFVQMKTSEKQRKWAVEDNVIRVRNEMEAEKRKRKETLFNKRIEPIEEALSLMACELDYYISDELGVSNYVSKNMIEENRIKYDRIWPLVYDRIKILNIKELEENWTIYFSNYWKCRENDAASCSENIEEEVDVPRRKIIEILDNIRLDLSYESGNKQ